MVYFWNGISFNNFLIHSVNVKSNEGKNIFNLIHLNKVILSRVSQPPNLRFMTGFVLVILVLMTFSALYEGIRVFRDKLMDQFLKSSRKESYSKVKYSQETQVKSRPPDLCCNNGPPVPASREDKLQIDIIELAEVETSKSSALHVSQTISYERYLHLVAATSLHMIHVCLGYIIMLAVMTFNIWILTAVAIGTGAGFLIFDYFKQLKSAEK